MSRFARRVAASKNRNRPRGPASPALPVTMPAPPEISEEEKAAGEELLAGCIWEQKPDTDTRFTLISMRFPGESQSLSLVGKEALKAMLTFAKSFVGNIGKP